jgi:hypothetical protein
MALSGPPQYSNIRPYKDPTLTIKADKYAFCTGRGSTPTVESGVVKVDSSLHVMNRNHTVVNILQTSGVRITS